MVEIRGIDGQRFGEHRGIRPRERRLLRSARGEVLDPFSRQGEAADVLTAAMEGDAHHLLAGLQVEPFGRAHREVPKVPGAGVGDRTGGRVGRVRAGQEKLHRCGPGGTGGPQGHQQRSVIGAGLVHVDRVLQPFAVGDPADVAPFRDLDTRSQTAAIAATLKSEGVVVGHALPTVVEIRCIDGQPVCEHRGIRSWERRLLRSAHEEACHADLAAFVGDQGVWAVLRDGRVVVAGDCDLDLVRARHEVGDRVEAVADREAERVGSRPAGQAVVADAANEQVRTVAAAQRIVPAFAKDPVIAAAAIEVVISAAAQHHVLLDAGRLQAASMDIVARSADIVLVPFGPDRRLEIAGDRQHRRRAGQVNRDGADLGHLADEIDCLARRAVRLPHRVGSIEIGVDDGEFLTRDAGWRHLEGHEVRVELRNAVRLVGCAVADLDDARSRVLGHRRGVNLAVQVGADFAAIVRPVILECLPKRRVRAALERHLGRADRIHRGQHRYVALNDHVVDRSIDLGRVENVPDPLEMSTVHRGLDSAGRKPPGRRELEDIHRQEEHVPVLVDVRPFIILAGTLRREGRHTVPGRRDSERIDHVRAKGFLHRRHEVGARPRGPVVVANLVVADGGDDRVDAGFLPELEHP